MPWSQSEMKLEYETLVLVSLRQTFFLLVFELKSRHQNDSFFICNQITCNLKPLTASWFRKRGVKLKQVREPMNRLFKEMCGLYGLIGVTESEIVSTIGLPVDTWQERKWQEVRNKWINGMPRAWVTTVNTGSSSNEWNGFSFVTIETQHSIIHGQQKHSH